MQILELQTLKSRMESVAGRLRDLFDAPLVGWVDLQASKCP